MRLTLAVGLLAISASAFGLTAYRLDSAEEDLTTLPRASAGQSPVLVGKTQAHPIGFSTRTRTSQSTSSNANETRSAINRRAKPRAQSGHGFHQRPPMAATSNVGGASAAAPESVGPKAD